MIDDLVVSLFDYLDACLPGCYEVKKRHDQVSPTANSSPAATGHDLPYTTISSAVFCLFLFFSQFLPIASSVSRAGTRTGRLDLATDLLKTRPGHVTP